ncbi:UVRA-like protein [Streptomyces sparsogenes DSM 40356]|uniref:UVRA-like protein n=1 Tax=Streptomyces sparsogenes DSM 40356 TaxID=1331668 RepID=A0A1R1SF82_9ACTN|nr:UVRA-like protein [Streptomyces sparsogenes DSM 40356]
MAASTAAASAPRRHPDFTVVDQAPLRGGVRSTPATALGVAEALRAVFSKATGLHPSWFSANGRGACPVCRGRGVIVTDLAFLDDVQTDCDACGGTRFNPTTLAATLHDRNIADLLELNAARAADLLAEHPAIARRQRHRHRRPPAHRPRRTHRRSARKRCRPTTRALRRPRRRRGNPRPHRAQPARDRPRRPRPRHRARRRVQRRDHRLPGHTGRPRHRSRVNHRPLPAGRHLRTGRRPAAHDARGRDGEAPVRTLPWTFTPL